MFIQYSFLWMAVPPFRLVFGQECCRPETSVAGSNLRTDADAVSLPAVTPHPSKLVQAHMLQYPACKFNMAHYVDIRGRLPRPLKGPQLGPRPRVDGGVLFVGQGMSGASPQLLHRRLPRRRRLLPRPPFLKENERKERWKDSILRLNIEPCLAVPLLLSLPFSFSCVCFVEPIAMRPTFVRLAKLRTALTRSER